MEMRSSSVPLLSAPVLKPNPLSPLSSCRVCCVREVGFDRLSPRVSGWMVKDIFGPRGIAPMWRALPPYHLKRTCSSPSSFCIYYSTASTSRHLAQKPSSYNCNIINIQTRQYSGGLCIDSQSWVQLPVTVRQQVSHTLYAVTVLCIFMVTSLNTLRQMILK